MAEASSSVRRTKFEVPRVTTQATCAGIVQKSKIFTTNREARGYQLKWKLSLGPGFAATLELTHCNNSDLELHATCYWWLEGRGIHCIAINDGFDANAEMPVARSVQMENPKFADQENHYGCFIVEIFVDERIEPLKQFSDDLLHIYELQNCTDMTIVIGLSAFPVHRLILSAASHVFTDMLRRTKQWENITLELHDLKPEVLRQLLNFIYTGKSPDRTYTQWPRLRMAAKRFGMDNLEAVCLDAMARSQNLKPDFLKQILDFICTDRSLDDAYNQEPRLPVPAKRFDFICMDEPSDKQWSRLLVVSDRFDMDDLKDVCVDVMTRSLCWRNAVDYLAAAIVAHALQLKHLASDFILVHVSPATLTISNPFTQSPTQRLLLIQMLEGNRREADIAAHNFYDQFIIV